MSILNLSACPICGTRYGLSRATLEQDHRARVGYECWRCGSALAWLGDDLWLHGDRWAFQRVAGEDRQDLLYRPLTVDELRAMARSAVQWETEAPDGDQPAPAWDDAPARRAEPAIIDVEARPLDDDAYAGGPAARPVVDLPPSPAPSAQESANALVPLAQVLPDGLTLALVQYRGSQPVPVAVFEDGELRAVPGSRRRSRGSPVLFVSVGVTLLCLFCSVLLLLGSWALGEGGILAPIVALPLTLPAPLESTAGGEVVPVVEVPLPTDTPLPAPTPLPTDTPPAPTAEPLVQVQGVTAVPAEGGQALVGEVHNTSGGPIQFVQVHARFYDESGNVVGTASAPAALERVEAGGRTPFQLVAQALPAFAGYDLWVDYAATDQAPVRLAVDSHRAFVGDAGAYHVAGTAWNDGDVAVESPRVVVTFYGEANEVVGLEAGPCEATTLQPGLGCRFEIVLANPPANLSHYKLQTEATRP